MRKKKRNPKPKTKRKSKPKSKPRRRHRMGKPPVGTVDWTPTFLRAITDGLHIRDACKEAKIDGTLPYARRNIDAEFKVAWDKASKIGTKMMEAEASRRAFHGTEKPVYQGKELVGHVREYSDGLMMFLLRGRKPGKYRDNSKMELSGKIETESALSPADQAALLAALAEKLDSMQEKHDNLGGPTEGSGEEPVGAGGAGADHGGEGDGA
jgi:hypothetical protein